MENIFHKNGDILVPPSPYHRDYMSFSGKCGVHKSYETYTEPQKGLAASLYCCKNTHTEANGISVLVWGSKMSARTFFPCI